MTTLAALSWFASVLALLGSWLVTSPRPRVRACAFAVWIVANLAMLFPLAAAQLWPQVGLYVAFTITAVLGLRTSLRSPPGGGQR